MTTTSPDGAPPAASVTPNDVVRFTGLQLSSSALAMMSRGDRRGMITAMAQRYGVDVAAVPDNVLALLDATAELSLELRRQSVAVIGNHEAFVRHTENGSLHQVVRPVRLSLTEGTVFQIRGRRPVCTQQGHACFGTPIFTDAHTGSFEWREVVKGDPHQGIVTYAGYIALNAVAGCAVGLPPHVHVDGERRTNPFVEREDTEVIRIVVSVAVVGPTPATGNPVVVNYTLDYDPRKDLVHMLLNLKESADMNGSVQLVPKRTLKDDDAWGQVTVAAGMSLRFDPSNKGVVGCLKDYMEIQSNAMKKALTVARRNAMKSHPALGLQAVTVNAAGVAIVPIVGWAGDDAAMRSWRSIQSALSRGLPLPDVEVIERTEVYDVETHGDGLDPDLAGRGSGQPATAAPSQAELEVAARAAAIAYIDQGLGLLTDAQVLDLAFDPDKMTLAQLTACQARLDVLLDSASR